MTYGTINDAVTRAGGAGTLLAGRYRIVKQLGQGGMGSVWLAEDTQLDNKPFAIKMLPSILVSNKRAYRQLKDEALVAMQLVHPTIVQIRAFEENNGNPFLVIDYVDGQTLDDYLAERGTLTEDEVIRVLRPVAAALDYAHGEGVVHRDVKPANVMIRRDGHPFILDFGIAREIQETMTRVTDKLSSGTLLYMSPEQLMGESPKPAQDVYSFAAMAYECLKGTPPFVRGAIEDQIKNKQPDPPPGGKQLVASLMSGLAKKPENRPATCAAVLEGEAFNHKEHKEAGGPRFVAALKGLVAAAALVLVAAGGIILYSQRQHQHTEARRSARIIGVHINAGRKGVQLWEGGPYWATTNIGAEKPEDSGYYFWWGDTVGYKREDDAWVASDGSQSSFSSDSVPTFGKNIDELKSGGWITAEGVLAPEHDAAHVQWGGDWRMPTRQELDDLSSKCDWTWMTLNGVKGREVRGRGAYVSVRIFLPAAGHGSGTSLYDAGSYGDYWSSVPSSDGYSSAWYLYFYSGYHYTSSYYGRSLGRSVRPVQGFTK